MRFPGLKWMLSAGLLLGAGGAAQAAALSVASVASSDLACVYNVTCHATVNDSTGLFPPATGYSGKPKLITRTIEGAPGSPAEGLNGFLYRVDFTKAQAETDINCVVWLKLKFGAVTPLEYEGAGSGSFDLFVITSEGVGTVGVSSAEKAGDNVTITFSEPVCPKNGAAPGQSSFWVGMSSPAAPVGSRAKAQLTFGGGIVGVKARTPSLP